MSIEHSPSLPKWVSESDTQFGHNEWCRNMKKALTIAVEALEQLQMCSHDDCDAIGKEALRRIEALGK